MFGGSLAASSPRLVSRCVLALFLLVGPSTLAQVGPSSQPEGVGRVTVVAGYRWVPNWYFFERASAMGAEPSKTTLGGPELQVGFGFMATDWLDVAVDLFGGPDWFTLGGRGSYTAVTYGGLIGVRLTQANLWFHGLSPYLGVEGGPTFSFVQSSSVDVPERLVFGFSTVGGFHWRFSDTWALTFDARWLLARGAVTGVAGFNAGGVLVSIGVSYLFAPAPQRDLAVPGFGAPSRL